MSELKDKDIDVIDKAFHNAWTALVQSTAQEPVPEYFESPKMRLHFIEIYKCLYEMSGGDKEFMVHWFNTKNKSFDCAPIEACQEEIGLLAVKEYFLLLK